MVKFLSLDELTSLKPNNNVNSPLHPTVPHLQAKLEGVLTAIVSKHKYQRCHGWVTVLSSKTEALVLGDRELAQLHDILVSRKKGTLDNPLVLKHRLLITCIKHTSAQQWCVMGYN